MSPSLKICIVALSLARGGLERSTALLSRMLTNAGYDVQIVIFNNGVDYEYKGKLHNLALAENERPTLLAKWKRIKAFKKIISENQFDYIIDARCRSNPITELLYLFYPYIKERKIYVVHSSKIDSYFTRNDFVAKMMIRNCKMIVCVSEGIKQRIFSKYQNENLVVIYNPAEKMQEGISPHAGDLPQKYILYLGRISEKVKNLRLLIDSYNASSLRGKSVKLLIVGDGNDKEETKQYIAQNGLQDHVIMQPFTPNVYRYLQKALFLVLTSYYEGFPMTLIEALSAGTPLVSVDCDYGPREIITNGYNGLLVENHNIRKLSEAMNRMIDDRELYTRCKANAQKSVLHLDPGNIIRQWKEILT